MTHEEWIQWVAMVIAFILFSIFGIGFFIGLIYGC